MASQTEAAAENQVSRQSITDARQVEGHGTEALKDAVFDRGTIALRDGAKMAHEPPDVQDRLAASENPKGELKKIAREKRESALAAKTEAASAALNTKLYGVIYADPPWRFEPYSRETGMDRAADNHYPTLRLEDVMALEVPAADDCVLFLWSTVPMLRHAMAVIDAWGFTYRSAWCWGKDKAGTGYWGRDKFELLLIAVKGDVPAPAPGTQPENLIQAPTGKHSQKPAAFRDIISGLFPNLPKVELFARDKAEGWDAWGNEAPPAAYDGYGEPRLG